MNALIVSVDNPNISTDQTCRRHIRVRVEAPQSQEVERSPANVSFVLDTSGSMSGEKLRRACSAIETALEMLCPEDHFSVLAYNKNVVPITPMCRASVVNRRQTDKRLSHLSAHGATNLSAGWLESAKGFDGRRGRCFLLTDGQVNRGLTHPADLENLASSHLSAGMRTTTFGLGADFNEFLLSSLATAGGGNFYFIETAEQMGDFFTSELSEVLYTVSPNARLKVVLPKGVEARQLTAFPEQREEGSLTLNLGDMSSAQTIDVFLAVDIPSTMEGDGTFKILCEDDTDADPQETDFTFEVSSEVTPPNLELLSRVALHISASARRAALEEHARGDIIAVEGAILTAVLEIRALAKDHEEIGMVAEALLESLDSFKRPMDRMRRKREYSESRSISMSRMVNGRAMKKLMRRPVEKDSDSSGGQTS